MNILAKFLQNHVLANLAFLLIMTMGVLSYLNMPREKDPEINFNWIQILTILPGATAYDIEQKITDPLEDALDKIDDIRFISSSSREGVSSILVRFNDIPERDYDKRLSDLRREIDNKANDELPIAAEKPLVLEITSSTAFPTASLVLKGKGAGENLRRQAYLLAKDLEQVKGIYKVDTQGLADPQLQVELLDEKLAQFGLNPADIANAVQTLFTDSAAGELNISGQQWLLRVVGSEADPVDLGKFQILSAGKALTLDQVADVQIGSKRANTAVSYEGQPAVMMSLFKKNYTNTIELVERVEAYIVDYNQRAAVQGLSLHLLDDQTTSTRQAIDVMQANALIGLGLVLCITWLFLGLRMALLTSIGIPFILAGTFWFISGLGFTLNNNVLLGIVISLGMLVDDAVVVIESIYYRLVRGMAALEAALASLKEVFWPVTAAVLTTIASFLPLTLLPGILGKFMMVVPIVVITALVISLVEAYWMLPAHVMASAGKQSMEKKSKTWRWHMTQTLQHVYSKTLLKLLRYPIVMILLIIGLISFVIYAFQSKLVEVNFFAMDSLPLFYVTVEMPADTDLLGTLATTAKVEEQVRKHLKEKELRGIISYSGMAFTQTEPLFGDRWGQIMVSVNPERSERRKVAEMIESMRADVENVSGVVNVTFFPLTDGPPTGRPVSLKVRGLSFDEISGASQDLQVWMNSACLFDAINIQTAAKVQIQIQSETERNIRISDAIELNTGKQAGDLASQIQAAVNPNLTENIDAKKVVREYWQQHLQDKYPDVSLNQHLKEDLLQIQVAGNNAKQRHQAVEQLQIALKSVCMYSDINDTDSRGRLELSFRLKQDQLREQGVNPADLLRHIRLLGDGEVVAEMRDRGEKRQVRIRLHKQAYDDVEALLDSRFFLADGSSLALRSLLDIDIQRTRSDIRHYNLRRTIQVEADIDKSLIDTVTANQAIRDHWRDELQSKYPNVNLDFSGELDDIEESLDAMVSLFIMGVGIMYMILGAQFRSYFQPLMILMTVIPLAFIGVVMGLIVSGNPLSLFTLYGVVALTGIAVNAAIVLMAAARDRLDKGMSITHATIYAARRRVIPILITSLTTIASLLSLATGFAGESMMWGPVATAIVWGLGFSTILTLYVIPFLFRSFVRAPEAE